MNTPPRSDDPSVAARRAPAPRLWTWCAWYGTAGPPPVLGRTSEDAERRLYEHLSHFYAKEAEVPSDNPRVRARLEMARYKDRGLLSHCAPDEAAAFHLWAELSSLSAEEALLRWRATFPCTTETDPLRGLASAMDRATRDARDPAAPTRLSREAEARMEVLSRFLEKLPRLSEARVEDLQSELNAPTT